MNKGMLAAIRGFFGDDNTDDEFLIDHITMSFTDSTKTAIIVIHDMNEQEYEWLKEERDG